MNLTKCGLDYIREDDEQIEIGAMTSYRSVETCDILKKYFNGVIADSVSSIIGTQFRNTVTVGGSVYGRFWFFGFSDTAFDVGYICCTLQERKHSAGDIYDDAL